MVVWPQLPWGGGGKGLACVVPTTQNYDFFYVAPQVRGRYWGEARGERAILYTFVVRAVKIRKQFFLFFAKFLIRGFLLFAA